MIIIRSLIKVQQNQFHWFKTGIQYRTRNFSKITYIFKLGSCSMAPSCSFRSHKKPTTPIITNIETHRRSNCVLTRTCLGPTDDYNEYTTVIDTSIETQDWNIENQHLFSKQAKRPIPFSSQESRTRDNIIRDCSFSDCQKFISSPFGVGCRIFAFGECRWPLTLQMKLIFRWEVQRFWNCLQVRSDSRVRWCFIQIFTWTVTRAGYFSKFFELSVSTSLWYKYGFATALLSNKTKSTVNWTEKTKWIEK